MKAVNTMREKGKKEEHQKRNNRKLVSGTFVVANLPNLMTERAKHSDIRTYSSILRGVAKSNK